MPSEAAVVEGWSGGASGCATHEQGVLWAQGTLHAWGACIWGVLNAACHTYGTHHKLKGGCKAGVNCTEVMSPGAWGGRSKRLHCRAVQVVPWCWTRCARCIVRVMGMGSVKQLRVPSGGC